MTGLKAKFVLQGYLLSFGTLVHSCSFSNTSLQISQAQLFFKKEFCAVTREGFWFMEITTSFCFDIEVLMYALLALTCFA